MNAARMWAACVGVAAAMATAGCGVSEGTAGVSSSTVRFDLGDGPLDFADVPFPSALYRDDAGQIRLGAWPNDLSDGPMFGALRELLAARDGFAATGNVTFAIDGGLNPASLPDEATAASGPSPMDGLALLDVDPDSPDRGRRFPLRLHWDEARGWLTLRPARGVALVGGRRYAAVLTTALEGADGRPLAASPSLSALLSTPESARDLPAVLDALAAMGVPVDRIAGLSWFTVEDTSRDAKALHAAVGASELPSVVVDAVFVDEAIDELLGVAAGTGAGIDLAPAPGTEGTRAVPHETTALVLTGRLTAPRFVTGAGADVGVIAWDAQGDPVPTGAEDVPFLLIVPEGAELDALPVVVAQHGFNASRTTGFALADTAGRAGYAVLAIDAFQHGDRAASAKDERNTMRDLEGPDGFAETAQLDVSSRVFGLSGGEEGMALFPGYALAAFEQFAADAMSALRFVREGEPTPLRQAHPSLGSLSFAPERVVFVGNSMGAVVGNAVVVGDEALGAAVLDVMPGSIVSTLVESGEFRPLTTTLLLPMVGVHAEPEDDLCFDPTVDLMRWVMEPVDPLALAPHLRRRRAEGTQPSLLVQLAGHDEVAAPTASESAVAAAGLRGVGTFDFATIEPADLEGDDASVAAVRFEGGMHGMLEVNLQESKYEPPLVPPFVLRDEPTVVVNPTQAVHDQIETFLRSHAEGHAAIVH